MSANLTTATLLPIHSQAIGGKTAQTVNGRDLHAGLNLRKDYTDWVKAQIKRVRLVEGRDFEVFPQKGEHPQGGRPTSEYHFTIEAAKHIAMMCGTDKGFEVRDYFLECERRAHQAAAVPAPRTPAEMMVMMAHQFVVIEQEQARQAFELDRLRESVAVIEARTQPESRHFTVMGYASLIGLKLDIRTAAALGRQCADLSRAEGLPIGDVTDPRFGRVHSYHESILAEVVGGAA